MSERELHQGSRWLLVIASGVIGVSLIICAVVGSQSLIRVKSMGNSIRVTGSAFESIRSDLATWHGEITVRNIDLKQGYAKLESDIRAVKEFLVGAGLSPDQYNIGTVRVWEDRNRDGQITGYSLSQGIDLEMEDVDRVTSLARDASALIERGVMMQSQPPHYLFTGLDTLKIEMIRRATENAKLRAEQLAETTGRKVGAPISAGVGVFQIRPQHSQEVSSYGMSDVTSIDKEIVSTVHVDFLIE